MAETWEDYKKKHPVSPGLDTFYSWLLFNLGFIAGEHFSDMLARQKKRWGKFWYAVVAITFAIVLWYIGCLIYKIVESIKQKQVRASLIIILTLMFGVLAFIIWLFIHIKNFVPGEYIKIN